MVAGASLACAASKRTIARLVAGTQPIAAIHPQPGDAILYDTTSARGEHVNILLRYQDGKLITVGGNEGNAIHVSTIDRAAVGKIRGFGAAE